MTRSQARCKGIGTAVRLSSPTFGQRSPHFKGTSRLMHHRLRATLQVWVPLETSSAPEDAGVRVPSARAADNTVPAAAALDELTIPHDACRIARPDPAVGRTTGVGTGPQADLSRGRGHRSDRHTQPMVAVLTAPETQVPRVRAGRSHVPRITRGSTDRSGLLGGLLRRPQFVASLNPA